MGSDEGVLKVDLQVIGLVPAGKVEGHVTGSIE